MFMPCYMLCYVKAMQILCTRTAGPPEGPKTGIAASPGVGVRGLHFLPLLAEMPGTLNPLNLAKSVVWRTAFALRESGQALERIGCKMQGIFSYEEVCELFFIYLPSS